MIKLHFKFKEHISEANREKAIKELSSHGAGEVRPLFPHEDDKELSSLYILHCQDDAIGRELMGLLNALEEIEFAEGEIIRKLIH